VIPIDRRFHRQARHNRTVDRLMTADLIIEPFRPALAPVFARLNRQWIERLFAIEPADEKVLREPEREVIVPGGQIFFARVAEEIVGTAAAVVHEPAVFELAKMAVTPTWQGHGIGQRLGQAVIEFARAAGADRLFLLTNSRLATAIRLYERLGFVHAPLPPDPGYGRADVYMELGLGKVSPGRQHGVGRDALR
jgi:putative acetyltransferase